MPKSKRKKSLVGWIAKDNIIRTYGTAELKTGCDGVPPDKFREQYALMDNGRLIYLLYHKANCEYFKVRITIEEID